jgi:hypothetical protein
VPVKVGNIKSYGKRILRWDTKDKSSNSLRRRDILVARRREITQKPLLEIMLFKFGKPSWGGVWGGVGKKMALFRLFYQDGTSPKFFFP